MKFSLHTRRILLGIFSFALLLCASGAKAQTTGTLRGTVVDPSGGAVAGVSVTAVSGSGQAVTVTSNALGAYEFRDLAPGQYQVNATAAGFEPYSAPAVAIAAGQQKTLDVSLAIQVEKQQVQVNGETQVLDVNPENNADATVIKGSDLDALPDDPDELASDLQALAGPSIGPNGGQMYIDGFSAGTLPPKSSIREIRVNSNPFSAQWDSLGFGRIEIITKAGGGNTHGSFFVLGNSKGLNTADPYASATIPGYYTLQYNGSIGGSLGKNTSYFFSAQQRRINQAELGALFTPSTGIAVQSGTAISNPSVNTEISPQLQYNLSKNNTLSLRYSYEKSHAENGGVSEFITPQATVNTQSYEHSMQLSDTQVFGARLVMDTRFQFNDQHAQTTPSSSAISISAPGYVTLGGSSGGHNSSTSQSYELQNYFTFTQGKHTLNFGIRWRDSQSDSTQISNGNGSYSFYSNQQFTPAEVALYNNQPVPSQDLPIRYSVTVSKNGGFASVNSFDAGAYIQDDYRWRSNVTLSVGLRYETQDEIADHKDFAPRVAVAYGLGKNKAGGPNFVVRGGWGMFYNRFSSGSLMSLARFNGVSSVSYTTSDPNLIAANFPNQIPLNQLTTSTGGVPSKDVLGPNFHVPYTMESAFTIEHQLSRTVTMTVNYINARGLKQMYTTNVNAPIIKQGFSKLDPTYRPNGILEDINQLTSEGIFKQNTLSTNFVVRATSRVTLNASYTLNYANATAGSVTFADDPSLDYGRANFDTRHRVFASGNITLPRGFSLSPFMTINSGAPYNLSSGTDWFFNGGSDRPTFAASGIGLPNGLFVQNAYTGSSQISEAAIAAQLVPVNYLTGPGNVSFNLRVAKTFAFGKPREATTAQNGPGGPGGGPGGPGGFGGPGGPGGGGPGGGGEGGGGGRGPGGGGGFGGGGFGGGGGRGGGGGGGGRGGAGGGRGGAASGRRYTLTLSANARNLFNVTNPGPRNGTDSSPYFLHSTALAQSGATTTYNRQISLQATFSF